MNRRPKTAITLAALGAIGVVLLAWQILLGSASPLGASHNALAADVGILTLGTPTPTAGTSQLTVTPTAGPGQLTVTPTATTVISPTATATAPITATATTEPFTATPTATSTVTPTTVITVTNFFIDVSATAGGSTVSLGRAIQLQNFVLSSGQPLPSGPVFWSGTVAGTQFDAELDLAVTSLEPLTLDVQRFGIVLATGQSANIAPVGTVTATVPGTTPINLSASQDVTGFGNVTFNFTGQIVTAE